LTINGYSQLIARMSFTSISRFISPHLRLQTSHSSPLITLITRPSIQTRQPHAPLSSLLRQVQKTQLEWSTNTILPIRHNLVQSRGSKYPAIRHGKLTGYLFPKQRKPGTIMKLMLKVKTRKTHTLSLSRSLPFYLLISQANIFNHCNINFSPRLSYV